MPDYVLHEPLPALTHPTLVFMLTGWIDASGAAAGARCSAVEQACERPTAGHLRRRHVHRLPRPAPDDGAARRRQHPARVARHRAQGRPRRRRPRRAHAGGPEPDSQWRRFAQSFAELAVELGVAQAVGFGAYPYATPHTRPSRLSSTSPSPELAASLPFLKNSVDVPAGMGAVLEQALFSRGRAGHDDLGAGAALRQRDGLPGGHRRRCSPACATWPTSPSTTASWSRRPNTQRLRLDELVAQNDDHVGMLRQLEQAFDTRVGGDARPRQHGASRAATSWPPSWSGSSASRVEASSERLRRLATVPSAPSRTGGIAR